MRLVSGEEEVEENEIEREVRLGSGKESIKKRK